MKQVLTSCADWKMRTFTVRIPHCITGTFMWKHYAASVLGPACTNQCHAIAYTTCVLYCSSLYLDTSIFQLFQATKDMHVLVNVYYHLRGTPCRLRISWHTNQEKSKRYNVSFLHYIHHKRYAVVIAANLVTLNSILSWRGTLFHYYIKPCFH